MPDKITKILPPDRINLETAIAKINELVEQMNSAFERIEKLEKDLEYYEKYLEAQW
jgi:hypothetical protein